MIERIEIINNSYEIVCFCDNNSNKCGENIGNKK